LLLAKIRGEMEGIFRDALKSGSGFEVDHTPGSDRYLFAGFRISAGTGNFVAKLEFTEAGQFDGFCVFQSGYFFFPSNMLCTAYSMGWAKIAYIIDVLS